MIPQRLLGEGIITVFIVKNVKAFAVFFPARVYKIIQFFSEVVD